MMERWLPVPEWQSLYDVSDMGRVRSVDRVIADSRGIERLFRGRILIPGTYTKYLVVALSAPGRKPKSCNVHQLVMLAFVGEPPVGHEVCHRDGNRQNCRLSNLRYGTRSSNALDRHFHGTMNPKRGEDAPAAKLTAPQVHIIRSMSGTQRYLGECFGVSHTTIGAIKRKEAWKHI